MVVSAHLNFSPGYVLFPTTKCIPGQKKPGAVNALYRCFARSSYAHIHTGRRIVGHCNIPPGRTSQQIEISERNSATGRRSWETKRVECPEHLQLPSSQP